MIRFPIILFIVFKSLFVFGQRNLQEIIVSDSFVMKGAATNFLCSMKRKDIELLQPNDVGDILQRSSGVTLKSYGGIGGMKTISVRGLGAQHSTMVVDGFSIQNTQTGQIDLGQLLVENVESIELSNGSGRSNLVPVSALSMGSSLLIETFENSFHSDQYNIRFVSKIASFGQRDAYLALKKTIRNSFISCFGRYRKSEGAYPFQLVNGSQILTGVRTNNMFNDLHGGVSFGFGFKNGGILSAAVRLNQSNQQLPGAVILYSSNGGQYLNASSRRFQAAYSITKSTYGARFFVSTSINGLHYIDSSYLNQEGMLQSVFWNDQLFLGGNLYYKLNQNWTASAGAEQQWSRMTRSSDIHGSPMRSHHFSLIALKGKYQKLWITGQLAQQIVLNEQFEQVRKMFRIHPFIQIELPLKSMFPASVLGIMYRNSMRVPSFNELYYNQIGNVNLLPEQANQFSVSFSLQRSNNKWKNAAKLSTYYNNILDKIVAVPTKNLFIWSMQNIGRVQIFGLEGMYENTYHLKTDLSVSVLMTYNYQSAEDVTSRASATYGDQIAYLPKHSGNIDLTFFYKKNGCRIGVTGMDKRYALNENIPSNQVDGFCLIDLSTFRNVEIKNHTLKIHLACKNVLNNSYAYIRYYVMPGRNYQVSLSYAFN